MPVCSQRNFLLVIQFNTDNFEVVFGNDLFGAKSLNWAAQDFVSIYLYYSSSFKHLMIVKSSEDQQQLYKKLTFNQFYMLIENLITILFDGRLFPVYYIKALEEFKMLMEALKREIDTKSGRERGTVREKEEEIEEEREGQPEKDEDKERNRERRRENDQINNNDRKISNQEVALQRQ